MEHQTEERAPDRPVVRGRARPGPGQKPAPAQKLVSPLAACGVVLALLALVGLARSYRFEPDPPARFSPARPQEEAGEPPDQVAALIEERPIDLNTASAAELELLPRVGPRLAERIIEERTQNGRFRSVEDLERVRGIGPRTIEQIAPLATAAP
jgi:competence protein ComEA